MKLLSSPRSPYVRKVMILVHEAGLASRVETVVERVAPFDTNLNVISHNPLVKIPTLILDDGTSLFDSRVICEYLDTLHAGPKWFPQQGAGRFKALRLQALGDGIMDLAMFQMIERRRPEEARSLEIAAATRVKLAHALDALEAEAGQGGLDALTIGTVSVGTVLGYLDFRFTDLPWREGRPKLAGWYEGFAARPSAQATAPVD